MRNFRFNALDPNFVLLMISLGTFYLSVILFSISICFDFCMNIMPFTEFCHG